MHRPLTRFGAFDGEWNNLSMESPQPHPSPEDPHVVIVGPDGTPLADGEPGQQEPTGMIEQPAKVMRVGSMIKQLLEEVRDSPLDDAARERLREVHARSIAELEDGLAPELVDELRRLSLPFSADTTPSDAELRIAQAQLVGWLEGLFHGIQTALFAQQMAARAQFEEMRRRAISPGDQPEEPSADGHPQRPPTGPYL